MAPGRVIAGLGTGDSKSAAENRAYDIPYDKADRRRLSLLACGRRLRDAGVTVWVGGGSVATSQLAADRGVACNLWEGQPAALAALQAHSEVTWAGPMPSEVPAIAEWLRELERAGATW